MTPTQGEHAQTEALFYASALENCAEVDFDRIFVPAAAVIRRLHAQVAALTAPPAQPAAPQCVAYAELDDAFESWLEDQDVDRLSDGYESWLNSVRSCWDSALRASHGQAPAWAAPEGWKLVPVKPTFAMIQAGLDKKNASVYVSRRVPRIYESMLNAAPSHPTAQAAPAAGAVAGPGWKLVPVEPTDAMVQVAHHIDLSYMPGQEGADRAAIYRAMLAASPTPAAQADSVQDLQSVHDAVTIELLNERVAYLEGKLKEADSVLEDAARYRWLRRWKGQEHEPPFTVQHEVDGTLWGGDLDAAVDAARKQGAKHD